MSSRGETVVKLRMTPYFWRLLGKYCVVLSLMHRSRGGLRMGILNTVTGIVTSHLGRHSLWIDSEFERIIKDVSLIHASGFSPDYVNAVATASSAQIPYVVRASTHPKHLARLLEGFRPILQPSRKPSHHARRPAEGPVKVRGGGVRAAAGTSRRETNPGKPVSGGDAGAGPGNDRPEPKLLKNTLKRLRSFVSEDEARRIIRELGRGDPGGTDC